MVGPRTSAETSRRRPGNPWALDEDERSPGVGRPGSRLVIAEAGNSQVHAKGRSSKRNQVQDQ